MADAVASLPPASGAAIAETPAAGLSSAQVAERRSRGLANAGGERTSRSVAEILRANILTRFNFILGVLLAVILVAGQPQDALFGVVLVTNALIGIAPGDRRSGLSPPLLYEGFQALRLACFHGDGLGSLSGACLHGCGGRIPGEGDLVLAQVPDHLARTGGAPDVGATAGPAPCAHGRAGQQ